DALVVDGHVHEDLVELDVLLSEGADQVVVGHAGDGEDRCAVHLGVVQAVQQMQPAWPGGRDTNPQAPRELGVAAGHKGSRFFMADVDEPDAFAMSAKGLHDAVDPVTWKAKNGVDAPIDEALDEEI